VQINFKGLLSRSKGPHKSIMPAAVILFGAIIGGGIAYTFIPPVMSKVPDEARRPLLKQELPLMENKVTTRTDTLPLKKTAALPVTPQIISKTVSVGKGDTLMKVLIRAGANPKESYEAITALSSIFDPRRLKVGQDITLNFTAAVRTAPQEAKQPLRLTSVSLKQDVDRQANVTRSPEDTFKAKETIIPLAKQMVRAQGRIDSSLFLSAAQAGIPTQVTLNLIKMFSYDVDFQREIQTGDSFEVYFEQFTDTNGRPLKTGRIQWASMTLSGDMISLYRFKTKDDGFTDYYNSKGQSVRKTLMRTPVDGARLTSRFGKRKHPVLGYTKMHRGADFGAPRGTPVMAAGNGTIEYAGRNGSFGNYVRIRHNSDYKTAYAHMRNIAKKIRKGSRVKQGQIIGYVGTSGRSTGNHLHYEVLKSGKQINPLSVKLPAGRKLKGKALAAFQAYAKQLDKKVALIPSTTKLAKLD